MCTICYPYVVYTSYSEYVSRRQSVCHIFEARLYILSFLIALLKRTSSQCTSCMYFHKKKESLCFLCIMISVKYASYPYYRPGQAFKAE